MTEYATAECATCHAIRPKNEMREVRVQRLTGRSHGSGTAARSSSGASSSYGGRRPARFGSSSSRANRSHSNTREHFAIRDVWVCNGCKAPRSDISYRKFIGLAVLVAAGGFVLQTGSGHLGTSAEVAQLQLVDREQLLEAAPTTSADASGLLDHEFTNGSHDEAFAELGGEGYQSADLELDAAMSGEAASEPYSALPVADARQRPNVENELPDQSHCANVTAEGRANAEYMKEIGC